MDRAGDHRVSCTCKACTTTVAAGIAGVEGCRVKRRKGRAPPELTATQRERERAHVGDTTHDGGWGLSCYANKNGVCERNMGAQPNIESRVGVLLE